MGVFSSRKLEKRLMDDVAFRVLAAGSEPDFRTISEFSRSHLKTLEGPFEQLLRLALQLVAMKLGRVTIDGSKIRANASEQTAMSYRASRKKSCVCAKRRGVCWPSRSIRTKTSAIGASAAATSCRPN